MVNLMRTTKKQTSKIKARTATPPPTPPAIAPVFDRFKGTVAFNVLLGLAAVIKLVCTTRRVNVLGAVARDVDWGRYN